ncbi:MAG: hypothetical protein AAF208_04930 [Cyanobacteria bacterium P01_A01_bin.45]
MDSNFSARENSTAAIARVIGTACNVGGACNERFSPVELPKNQGLTLK